MPFIAPGSPDPKVRKLLEEISHKPDRIIELLEDDGGHPEPDYEQPDYQEIDEQLDRDAALRRAEAETDPGLREEG